jgi:hypothetical protein
MTEIKRTSYKGREIERSFQWAKNNGNYASSIYDLYKSPSSAKRRAFDYCANMYKELDGVGGMYYTGAGCQTFSIAYMTKSGAIVKHTATYDYIVK